MENKIIKMKEIIKQLNYASKMYYQNSNSVMTDYEYDKLYDELCKLEKETNTVFANSPTVNVEAEVSQSLEKFEHKTPMLSLSKTKSVDDLFDFIGDKEGVLSWKLDGLTIVLTYNNGKLVRGVTRGNGIIGEVVTENVKQFTNIPFTIPYKGELVVRGEAVIKYSDFERMNGEIFDNGGHFKNPRNLCSGSVRQLDSRVTARRNINCIIFSLISTSDNIVSNSVWERSKWLKTLGFDVVEMVIVNRSNLTDAILSFKEKIPSFDIPSDGLVLTYDDVSYGHSLGSTAKYPRHSIAFKWKDETVYSTLRNIEWRPSRSGLINPVAVFDPIEIDGTVVSRASVHNISIMKSLKLGIGDTIKVYKANMIIPQIASDVEGSNNVELPKVCPACGNKTEVIDNNGVKYLSCPNDFCCAKFIRKLDLFTSRDAMNIDGISEQLLTRLYKEQIVTDYSDLYHLDRYEEKIISFEGFGRKSYEKMINSIEKSRKIKVANFIYSLGISGIGLSRAKLICRKFNNDIDKIRKLTFEDLNSIASLGDVIAHKWVETFSNPGFLISLDNILKEVEFIDDTSFDNSTFDGLSFVITGKVKYFKNRSELVEYIENLGGIVVNAVSTNVNSGYLVYSANPL